MSNYKIITLQNSCYKLNIIILDWVSHFIINEEEEAHEFPFLKRFKKDCELRRYLGLLKKFRHN